MGVWIVKKSGPIGSGKDPYFSIEEANQVYENLMKRVRKYGGEIYLYNTADPQNPISHLSVPDGVTVTLTEEEMPSHDCHI